ncbi:MAG: ABC transporter permease [Bacillota bacterium]|nr:ABC transporter permease [Bacillota bacterium]
MRKLTARKKYIVFLIIEILICVLWCVISLALGRVAAGSVASDLLLADMPMSMLGFFTQIYTPLIIFMAACDLFTSEVHDGTIRAGFMRPVSRFKQFASRVLAIWILAAVYLVVLFVLTTAIKGVLAGSTAGLGASFISYFLDLAPLLVLVLFAAFINQFSGSPSLSVILCVILYIGFYVLGILEPRMSGLLFTGYLQWHNLWVGTALPFGAALAKVGILAGYGMVLGCAGYYLFERREV